MQLIILISSKAGSICGIIVKALSISQNGLKTFTLKVLRRLRPGISQKREESGTVSMVLKHISRSLLLTGNAAIAAQYLKPKHIIKSFAPINVNHKPEGIQRLMTCKGSVNIVDQGSSVINTQHGDFAQGHVITSIKKEFDSVDMVYDLTVAQCHEFFANGVLVHNSLDAIRYGVTHIRRKPNYGKYSVS